MSGVVTVRRAKVTDASRLLEWRNDPKTRWASRDSHPVEPEQHESWLGSVLQEESGVILIGEYAGEPVGTVRFAPVLHEGIEVLEVSITIAPNWRGQGIAGSLLSAGEGFARAHLARVSFVAFVKADNWASLRLFSVAGYDTLETDDFGIWLHKKWESN